MPGERGRIVVKEGPYRGTYDSPQDLQNKVNENEKILKDYAINLYRSSGINPEQFNDEWYEKLPNSTKDALREMAMNKDLGIQEAFEQAIELPDNKQKIIAMIRSLMGKDMNSKKSDDQIWGELTPEQKRYWFKRILGGK